LVQVFIGVDYPVISVNGLTFAYRDQPPLFSGLSFTVPDGGLIRIVGPSGCGKTTLLYCLCGMIPRHITGSLSGEAAIDGIPVREITQENLPRAAALVFQQPGDRMFLPEVEDELAFVLENLCFAREEMRARVEQVLALTGLSGKRHETPAKLSGGQQKLLALACALVLPPRVLLLDELTAGLDGLIIKLVLDCVNELRKQGCAVVVTDHNAGLWEGTETTTLCMTL
jgi:energy-coupling factor transporter ATP-binding protein EcfA2